MKRRPAKSTLFPYTTLFRSLHELHVEAEDAPVTRGREPRVVRLLARLVRARDEFRARLDPLHGVPQTPGQDREDRKSTRLNSSHLVISYAVFCLKKEMHKHL